MCCNFKYVSQKVVHHRAIQFVEFMAFAMKEKDVPLQFDGDDSHPWLVLKTATTSYNEMTGPILSNTAVTCFERPI